MGLNKKAITALVVALSPLFATGQNCTVNAGIDEDVCEGGAMILKGNSQGLIDVAAEWSQTGGPSLMITDPTDLNTGVTGFVPGNVYTFRIEATCQDGRVVHDEVDYEVFPITAADAGGDFGACPGTGYTLGANSPGTGESGEWTIESTNNSGISIDDPGNPNSTYSLPDGTGGTTTLRWTITNPNGCSSYDEITLTNYGGETPVDAGPDQNLSKCYTVSQSTQLDGSYDGTGAGGQQGTWVVVSGPNYPTFSNVNAHNTWVSGLVEGSYLLRWEVSGPCATGSDTMRINVPEALQDVTNANTSDIVFCNGATQAVLEGNTPNYANETSTWAQLSGPTAGITITDPNSPNTSVKGLDGSSDYTFRYTIEHTSTGCSSSENADISYPPSPSISITGGDQFLDCGDTATTINYSQTGGSETQYRILSGPYTTDWAWGGNGSRNLSFSDYGTYTLEFRRNATGYECNDAFDQVNVIVGKQPTASNAGTDQILACNVVETDLAGNNPVVGTGQWTQVSGPNTATITDEYDRSTHISNLIEGEYVFRWVISGGPNCTPQQDEVMVVVSTPTTSTTAAGADQTICGESIVYLSGADPAGNEIGWWRVEPDAGISFSDTTDPNATVTGLQQSTTYTFIWRVESACAWAEDTAEVTTGSDVGPSIANAGGDQCMTDGTVVVPMDGNDPTVGTGTWNVVSGPGGWSFGDANTYNTNFTATSEGTYLIEWAISSFAGCQTSRDTCEVNIYSQEASGAAAGTDTLICGTSIDMYADAPTFGSGAWHQLWGNGGYTIADAGSNTTTISNLTDGTYAFGWEVSYGNSACSATEDTVILYVSTPPSSAEAGAFDTICSGTSITLDADAPGTGTGYWSMKGSSENTPTIIDLSDPKTTVNDLVTGQYTFQWNVISGMACPTSTDTVLISVSAPANAGADQQVCNSTETVLSGTEGTSGLWTEETSHGATLTPNTNYSAIAGGLQPEESYTFIYTVPSIYGCPSTQDTVEVVTSPFGTDPNAGDDQAICTSMGDTVVMAANSLTFGTGNWNTADGPNTPTILDPGSPTTKIENLVAGTYVFEWEVDYNGCGNYQDIVRVEVYDPPSVAEAGPDQVDACVLDARLAADTPTVGVGTWTLASGPGTITIDEPNQPASHISSPSATGDYVFQWEISNGNADSNLCASSIDFVTVSFSSIDTPTVANAGLDIAQCETADLSLAADPALIGTGTWDQVSGPNSANIVSPNSETSTLGNLAYGTYLLEWAIEEGACRLRDTLEVTISENITATVGADLEYCQFQPVTLNGNDPSPGTGTWTLSSGPNTPYIIDTTLYNTTVTGTQTGTYLFDWTVQNGACPSSTDQVQVDVIGSPATDLAITGDTVCSSADATVSIGSAVSGVDYNAYKGTTFITSGTGTGADLGLTIPNANLSVGSNYIILKADNGTCSEKTLDTTATVTRLAAPTVTLDASPNEIDEDGGSSTLTATLSNPTCEAVTVTIAVTGGTAEPADYTLNDLTLTIPYGSTSASTTLDAVTDTDYEDDETVDIEITAVSGGEATEDGTQSETINIDDENDKPLVSISATEPTINEDGTSPNSSTIILTLSKTITFDTEVIVDYVQDAQEGVDFVDYSTTVNIPAGTLYGYTTITAVDDGTTYEGTETARVRIISADHAIEDGNQRVDVDIVESDPIPSVTLSVDNGSIAEATSEKATFTLTLSNPSYQDVTVDLSYSGTADLTDDYTRTGTQVVISAGDTKGYVTVTAVDDNKYEPNPPIADETVIIDISSVTNGTESATQQEQTAIVDDDTAPTVTLSATPTAIDEESAETSTLTATLSNPTYETVYVTVSDAGTGTAELADYTGLAVITINEDATSGTTTLTAVEDDNYEDDETVDCEISAVSGGGATEDGTQEETITIDDDGDIPVVTLSATSPIAEDGGISTITATLSHRTYEDVTVTIGVKAAGTNAEAGDYTLDGTTITITGGNLTGTETLTGVDDAVYEGDEDVVVEISNVSGGGAVEHSTPQEATITITDDETPPTVTLSASPTSIPEDGSSSTLTATLSGLAEADVDVTIGVKAAGTDAEAGDYTLSSGTITISGGSLSDNTETLTSTTDAVYERDEDVVIEITAVSSNASEDGTQEETITISDDEVAPTVSLSVNPASIAEASTSQIIVTLSGLAEEDVDVTIDTTGVTAESADYTLAATVITIAGETWADSTTLTAVDDTPYENSETVDVDITGVSGADATEDGTQQETITITDATDAPTVTLSATPTSINEVGGTSRLTATLSNETYEDVTVTIDYTEGTAEAGDYTDGSLTITIPAGETSDTTAVRLAAVDDADYEGDETVLADITNVSGGGATEDGTQQATITITDAEDIPTVALSVDQATIDEATTEQAVFTATLSNLSYQDVVIDLSFSGTATLTDDYLRSATQITVTAGSSTAYTTVTAVDDSKYEPGANETVIVDIDNVTNGTEDGTQQAQTAIVDDDPMPSVTLSVDQATIDEATTEQATFTATLSNTSTQDVVIDLSFSGTATLTDDYLRSATQITVTAGNSTAYTTVTAVDDSKYEPGANETVIVDIDNVINGSENGTQQEQTAIVDDDAAPSVTLSVDVPTIDEATTEQAVFTATLSHTSTQDVTVHVSFSGTATLTDDYDSSSTIITIPANSNMGYTTVTAVNDTIYEPGANETVIVDIVNVINGSENGTQQEQTAIVDNEAAPLVSLSVDQPTIDEATTEQAIFTATLDRASTQDISVELSFSGTAALTDDYDTTASIITIPAGSISGYITVTAVDDSKYEPGANETVIVDIDNVSNGTEDGTQQAQTAIVDDDAAPSVTLSVDNPTIDEALTGVATFTATLSHQSTQDITVSFGVEGSSTADLTDDYTLSMATVTIPADSYTGTITVTAVNDSEYETGANETVVIEILNVINGTENGTQEEQTEIIDDESTPQVSMAASPDTIGEAGGVSIITTTLSVASFEDVVIELGYTGTATVPDYTDNAAYVTITSGNTTAYTTITAVDDDQYESYEDVIIDIENVTGGGAAELGTQRDTVTITDNENRPVVNNTDETTPEDTPINICLTASDADGDSLDITIAFGGPASGLVSNLNTGDTCLTYTPNPDFNGNDTVYVIVDDGHGGRDTARVGITVTPVNDNPVVLDDTLITDKNTPIDICLTASDVDGDTLDAAEAWYGPANGTLSNLLTGDTCFSYSPDPGFFGLDTVYVVVPDSSGGSDTAQILINVINNPPVGVPENFTINEDDSLQICLSMSDADGDSIDATSALNGPSLGTTGHMADGDSCFWYYPTPNANGPDSMWVVITDQDGGTDTVPVVISITPVNDDPVISGGDTVNVITPQGEDISICLDFTDADGDTLLTTSMLQNPAYGTITGIGDSCLTYTPQSGYTGTDSVVIIISDGHGGSDTVYYGIQITPNSGLALDAVDDDYTITTDVATLSPLDNDTEQGSNSIYISSVSTPEHGTVSIVGDTALSYTPEQGYCGPEIITYMACNDYALCDSATIVLSVSPQDSDGDLIPDYIEVANGDSDGDGIADYLDTDSDNDSIPDARESNIALNDACDYTVIDTDNDGIPDYLDTDSDNDHIPDVTEDAYSTDMNYDTDGDGIADYRDDDSDGDGRTDLEEGLGDCDRDEIPNYIDPDDDCEQVWIPNGFSPNGDGVNDYLVIKGLEGYPDNKVEIYNRWGNLVYEADNYLNDWDGQSQASLTVGKGVLPDGTYFYVLYLGDGSKPKTGYITLNR